MLNKGWGPGPRGALYNWQGPEFVEIWGGVCGVYPQDSSGLGESSFPAFLSRSKEAKEGSHLNTGATSQCRKTNSVVLSDSGG